MLRLVSLTMVAVLLSACSGGDEMSDAEREAFRQELIDKALNDETRKAGDAFLAQNRLKPDVVETESGLQYRIIRQGDGPLPQLTQVAQVNYEGRSIDGVLIEQSTEGQPSNFPIKRVIKGWREALLQMPIGSEWELYVPADLAYGATSPNELIPANSTLIFRVELLSVTDELPGES